jgi:hypothetical protein
MTMLDGRGFDVQLKEANRSDADIVSSCVQNIGDIERVGSYSDQIDQIKPSEIFEVLSSDNFTVTSNVILRLTCIENIGGFDEPGKVFEDWDLWLRSAADGWSSLPVPGRLTKHRSRRGSA